MEQRDGDPVISPVISGRLGMGKKGETGLARGPRLSARAWRGARGAAERRAGEPAEAGAGCGEREKGGEGLGRFGLMGWRESGRESGQTGQLGRFAGLGR